MSLAEAARELDVSPATLRRWVADGLVPLADGEFTRGSLSHARIVSKLRARGHSMDEIREASRSGRLAYGFVEELFPPRSKTYTLEEAAEDSGLEPALIERIWSTVGFSVPALGEIAEDDLELLRYIAAALHAGFPLVAFLQLVRVYGQALARIADAEVKLFHLYVHEPLIHEGVDHLEMAEEMQGLARDLLPLAAPIMDRVHQRFLQHFLDQDVVGHMELEVDSDSDLDLGRLRVAIAFADLAGYTRLTEEAGEDEAVDIIERFVEGVGNTLPDDARIIKTIGDEVMVVASDAAALLDWAVGFQALQARAPAAAHRHPPGPHALPRRRLLRPRGQPRGAGGRARSGRRGARHALAGGGRGPAPRVRAHRRGQAQGLLAVDRAVPRAAGRGG